MKATHYIILCLLGVLFSQYATAQTNDDFFVLGTLNAHKDVLYNEEDSISCYFDHYDPHEKALARHVRTSVARRYGHSSTRLKKEDKWYYLYTCPQFRVTDSLYQLEENITPTKEQALAYMHGVYLRYGYCGTNTYFVVVHNPVQGRLFYRLAQQYGLTDVNIKAFNNLPHTTYVYFTPTPEFLAYIKPTAGLKKKLVAANKKMIEKVFGKDVYQAVIEQKNEMQQK